MKAAGEKTPFVPGPIACAGDVPLSDSSSGQPVMAEAILDYFRPITIGVVTTVVQNGDEDPTQDGVVKEITRTVRTAGVVRPGGPEKLEVLSGGERSWQSSVLYTTPDFNVDTDTKIVIEGTNYRVMSSTDYSVNGYVRYDLEEDYERRA